MNKPSFKPILLNLLVVSCALAGGVFGQTVSEQPKLVNFRYSQNPKTKPKTENQTPTTAETNKNAAPAEVNQNRIPTQNPEFESRSAAVKTLEVARRANAAATSPTEIYKVGAGDVLFISLQNAPGKAANYFTVLNDGTIDYPLAGEMVTVQNLTVEEIEDLLKEKIKLYENPQVSVKVREHASHTITVLGLVEKAGEKHLQREAVPLYVIRAEAITQPNVNLVVIKRANSDTEKIDLRDAKAEDVLIFPGDIVEFKSVEAENARLPKFYYIGGNIASGGQKDFYQGITLTQAILASGGLKKPIAKTVVIRRKNDVGLLSPLQFDLKAIKDGKQPDPILIAGDTIEIGN